MAQILTPRRSVLDEAERHCWKEYLDEVRDAEPGRYGEVEPWAWQRLQAKLRVLDERKVAA